MKLRCTTVVAHKFIGLTLYILVGASHLIGVSTTGNWTYSTLYPQPGRSGTDARTHARTQLICNSATVPQSGHTP